MEGEGKKLKKKCFTIKKSKTGRKYITLRGKRLYLSSLLKKANKKRMKIKKKPLQRITSQNIENVLLSVIKDVKDLRDPKTQLQMVKKIEKEGEKIVKKLEKDVKKDIKEDTKERKEIIEEAGEKVKDLKDEIKKKNKRVKIRVVPDLEETRPSTPTLEGKEQDDIKKQLNKIQESLIERIQRIQLGGMLLDKDKALDNTEIDRIMNKYKDFKGVYALDQVYKVLPLIEPKSEGGLILNLDKSGEPGSHWTCLYFNGGGNKPQICYYDSFGRPPKDETLRDIKNIVKKLDSDKHMKLKVNNIVNQDKSTVSCGYLCIKFLMDMFRGKSFKSATGYSIKKSEEQAEQLYDKFRYIL